MQFDIITIFPNIFDSYFDKSILKRALKGRIIKVAVHNLRDFSTDKHRKVDDKPYGGGAGMVLMAEPILRTVSHITYQVSKKFKKRRKTKIIIFSAKGKQFTQKMAYDWAKKYDRLILISGRYEGIDERVKKILKAEEISIGPYVLTDGDVAAMIIISAVTRLLPGAIKWESLREESYFGGLVKKEKSASSRQALEYPHYTRPEVFVYKGKKYLVPKVLLTGNHKKIAEYREKQTKYKR